MSINILHVYAFDVKLAAGDMIIDTITGDIGILVVKTRRLDMIEDDIYLWEVVWSHPEKLLISPVEPPQPRYMEEDGLKFSIIIGMIDWYSSKGITYEVGI